MKEQDRIENLSATLLWKDVPVLDFSIEDGMETTLKPYPENREYYPLEFQYNEPGLDALNFFCWRKDNAAHQEEFAIYS